MVSSILHNKLLSSDKANGNMVGQVAMKGISILPQQMKGTGEFTPTDAASRVFGQKAGQVTETSGKKKHFIAITKPKTKSKNNKLATGNETSSSVSRRKRAAPKGIAAEDTPLRVKKSNKSEMQVIIFVSFIFSLYSLF